MSMSMNAREKATADERDRLHAHVIVLRARVAELMADRDSWEQQASDRTSDAISAMRRAELAEARVAELEAQDHVGVYTCQQRRDSFPVFVPGIMLNRWIPTGTKLYAAPVLPAQAVPDGYVRVRDAIAICRQEAAEWDSDNLITHKNYAATCADRIAMLATGTRVKR